METGHLSRKVEKDGKTAIIHEPASVALRIHCAELLLERGHGKPHQAILVPDPGEGVKSLRDLILGAMALNNESELRTIEHEPDEAENDEADASSADRSKYSR
jgi:hypothetical protein